jgi:hypothetical protein
LWLKVVPAQQNPDSPSEPILYFSVVSNLSSLKVSPSFSALQRVIPSSLLLLLLVILLDDLIPAY